MASEAFILLFWASTVTPGGAKCFLSSFLLHYLSTLSHQGHSSSSPQHLPPPTTTGPLRWRIIMCCYLPFSPPTPSPTACASLFSSCPPASVPHRWWDTNPFRVVIFIHARLGCDDIHELTHKCSKWVLTSGVSLAALLCWLCVTCVNRGGESDSHTELIHILGSHRFIDQLSCCITITVHGEKRVASDTSCLRWAGYTAATFFFFFNLTVHLRVTVIVRVGSLRLADEKITAANIQMVSL